MQPQKKASKWEREIPDRPDPVGFMEYGMALRGQLRETTDDPYADRVFERYTKPWTDLPADHVDGTANEKVLCGFLLLSNISHIDSLSCPHISDHDPVLMRS